MTASPHLSPVTVAGDLLFLSGQLAFGFEGKIEGDIAAQTTLCLERLETVLKEQGLNRAAIVKVSVWLTDRSTFAAFNDAYGRFFGDHRPARSTVVSCLALEDALVEIDAIASVTASRR